MWGHNLRDDCPFFLVALKMWRIYWIFGYFFWFPNDRWCSIVLGDNSRHVGPRFGLAGEYFVCHHARSSSILTLPCRQSQSPTIVPAIRHWLEWMSAQCWVLIWVPDNRTRPAAYERLSSRLTVSLFPW